jgi:predicted phage terminase large subunit-like protein
LEAELIRRRLTADRLRHQSLSAFVQDFWPVLEPATELRWGWGMDALCAHLEAVTDGSIRYLLITVPPGMMKSLMVSVFWPAWEWGPKGRSNLRYLTTAFKHEHGIRDARRMRDVVSLPAYQALYGDRVRLVRDSESDFENASHGWRKVSSMTSLTGERGDRVIIDDPNNVSRAESVLERKKVNSVVTETAPTRLNDPQKSAIVIIMQRVHQEDAAGEVLKRHDYVHLNLPMRFDPSRRCRTVIGFEDPRTVEGELLFPERYDEASVAKLERDLGSYAASAQLQQEPVSRAGTLFKRDWFEIVDAPDVTIRRWARAWDLASTAASLTSSNPDWTVGLKGGVDEHGVIWITHMVRMQKNPGPRDDDMAFIAKRDGYDCVQRFPQDPGQAGKSQAESLRRHIGAHGFVRFKPITRDKVSRANEALKMAEYGKIKLINFKGLSDFLEELCAFPNSAHDDIVDALSDLVDELVEDEGLDLSGVY